MRRTRIVVLPMPNAISHRVAGRVAALAATLAYLVHRFGHVDHWDLLDDVNLAIHEAGHVLFQGFGEPMLTLGGSLFQVVVPTVFVGYFAWTRQRFAAAITLSWVVASLLNVALYVGDAQAQELPLLGGENTVHDWWFLLTEWDQLPRDGEFARSLRFGSGALTAVLLGMGLATLRESSAGPHPQRTTWSGA
jgi:hypothetical protein